MIDFAVNAERPYEAKAQSFTVNTYIDISKNDNYVHFGF